MSIKAYMAQAKRLKLLEGETCTQVDTGRNGAVLRFSFGTLHPLDAKGSVEAEKRMIVECPWRLETKDEVIVGSGDEGKSIDLKLPVLVNRRVIENEVFPPSYTARIRFDGDYTLWLFPDDSRDYVAVSRNPWVHWYVVGREIPNDWES